MAADELPGQAEQIAHALKVRVPATLDGPKRSSVALLLRCGAGGRLEVLFIKRSSRKGDRFSGDVAFPGGKQEAGETDLQTVVREVWEEIGVDLEPADAWKCLGWLDDRPLLEQVVRCFVFLQLVSDTPLLTLQTSEVAGCGWVPLDFLCRPSKEVCLPRAWARARFDRAAASCQPMKLLSALRVPRLLGLHQMCFNAIDLPLELAALSGGAQREDLKDPGVFRLWGFTLFLVGDFMVSAQLRKSSDAFTVFPVSQVLGVRLRECPHASRPQNLAYNIVKLLAWRVWRVPLGLGQASRYVLYLETLAALLALFGACALARRRLRGAQNLFRPL